MNLSRDKIKRLVFFKKELWILYAWEPNDQIFVVINLSKLQQCFGPIINTKL